MEHEDEQRSPSPHHAKQATNYHVFLSFGLSAFVTVVGFAATWGRTEQWREGIDERLKSQEIRDEALSATVAQHEATIRVIDSQYQHIGKQLDRVEDKLEDIAKENRP